MLWAAVLASCAAPLSQALADRPAAPRITIIIDDLGYALAAGTRAVNLPGPVVCAVLPQTPRARRLAELAHARGKEVLLHLPLQSVEDPVEDAEAAVEPGALTLDMSRSRFADTLAANVAAVPHVIGVNGHRGSLLTRHPGHMAWLMEELGERGLLFIDSRTTHLSVALDMAREHGVPATRRDVFLDAARDVESIEREFRRLKTLARTHGSALGIGHPYPATLDFLERALPELDRQGFALVGIRSLLEHQMSAAAGRDGRHERPAAGDTTRGTDDYVKPTRSSAGTH